MNTKEMIEVMQAFEDGKKIEFCDKLCPLFMGCSHHPYLELANL